MAITPATPAAITPASASPAMPQGASGTAPRTRLGYFGPSASPPPPPATAAPVSEQAAMAARTEAQNAVGKLREAIVALDVARHAARYGDTPPDRLTKLAINAAAARKPARVATDEYLLLQTARRDEAKQEADASEGMVAGTAPGVEGQRRDANTRNDLARRTLGEAGERLKEAEELSKQVQDATRVALAQAPGADAEAEKAIDNLVDAIAALNDVKAGRAPPLAATPEQRLSAEQKRKAAAEQRVAAAQERLLVATSASLAENRARVDEARGGQYGPTQTMANRIRSGDRTGMAAAHAAGVRAYADLETAEAGLRHAEWRSAIAQDTIPGRVYLAGELLHRAQRHASLEVREEAARMYRDASQAAYNAANAPDAAKRDPALSDRKDEFLQNLRVAEAELAGIAASRSGGH